MPPLRPPFCVTAIRPRGSGRRSGLPRRRWSGASRSWLRDTRWRLTRTTTSNPGAQAATGAACVLTPATGRRNSSLTEEWRSATGLLTPGGWAAVEDNNPILPFRWHRGPETGAFPQVESRSAAAFRPGRTATAQRPGGQAPCSGRIDELEAGASRVSVRGSVAAFRAG